MKLLLAGYYGSGNIGDDAILEALLNEIRAGHPDVDIRVIAGDTRLISDCFGIGSINKNNFPAIIKGIIGCDALILGGGGLLQDRTSKRSLVYYLSLIYLARIFKKKVLLLAQGIGPVKNRWLIKRALHDIDLVTVRDVPSLEILRDAHVHVKKLSLTADISLLLKVKAGNRGSKLLEMDGVARCREKLIGISVRDLVNDPLADQRYRAIAELCDHLIKEKDSQVVFLPFKYPEDIDVSKKIMGMMKNPAHIFFRQCRPSDMIAVIASLDAVIGMRLHSLIFSAIVNKPAFGLSYDPKVSIFQRMVGMPHMEFRDIDQKHLRSAVDGFLDGSVKNPIGVDALREKANQNIVMMNDVLEKEKIHILGVPVDSITMEASIDKIKECIKKGRPSLIVTPNPEMLIQSQTDMELKKIISGALIAPPDGIGLMLAARLLGRKFRQRIPGIDLMGKVIAYAKKNDLKIFLLGGTEGVAKAAGEKIGENIAGTFHGYSSNDRMVVQEIKKVKPDILFIGLGSPKQEKWAQKHLLDLGVPVVMCIGGSFDVISGKFRRAPLIMRKFGLEWLFRLIQQPSRAKRMFILPWFIIKVAASRFSLR